MRITATERKCQFLYGCSHAEAIALNDGLPLGEKGSPVERFRQQRWMAEARDIEWTLTFKQWKGVWSNSGKWENRGYSAGLSYMARKGNKGPFSVDNVFITELPLVSKYARVTPAQKAAKLAQRYECSLDDFESVEEMNEVRRRFIEQRWRAKQRCIGWELSFSDWWKLWKESGLWESRGRSSSESAVMARRGDVGPYSKENVYITTLANNFVDSWVNKPNRNTHPACIRRSA